MFGVVFAVVLSLEFLQDREWVLSMSGFIAMGVVALLSAYLWFFVIRQWVYLYDSHLALHPRLAKLIKDHLGYSFYTPKVIYYQQITRLRRSRGLGAYNALAIFYTGGKHSEKRGAGIHYSGIENYPDLETELLRRVPPTCELCGMGLLFRKRPFK
ncbi:MAG: hypothetical protein NTW68_07550 [candidate division NC10 bacterium]|nr:hypothetical protein [candidate division NC10 bacterium]